MFIFRIYAVVLLCLFCSACSNIDSGDDVGSQSKPVSLDGFDDVIKHWRDQHPDEEELLLDENDVRGIADNLLLYQRDNGGWAENQNPLLKLSAEQKQQLAEDKLKLDSSLDNRNTYTQIRYLAHAWQQTNNPAYREATESGIQYLLRSQYANGGWAHSPPSEKGYRSHITFADEVMSGVLSLLRDIAHQTYPFDFLDAALVTEVRQAWQKGENLLLDLQVVIDGELTIWAGQYDKHTLKPTSARAFELPGLATQESVAVVRYLMAGTEPDTRIVNAVDSAVRWFEKAKIYNLRVKKISTKPVRFRYHTSSYDLIAVQDENADPIWARFYDLETQKPFMANRDGGKVYKLEDVERERRTGYAWYGYWPRKLLEKEHPVWKERHRKN